MGDTYRTNPDRRYPCVSVDTDGYLYVEQSEDTGEDVNLRLTVSDKLALAGDLIQAARKELREQALAAANAEAQPPAPSIEEMHQAGLQAIILEPDKYSPYRPTGTEEAQQ